MPYCTIEEAWTQSLNPELQDEKTNAINYQPSENVDLFELDKKLKKKVNRVPQKSRTYKTLDEHSKKEIEMLQTKKEFSSIIQKRMILILQNLKVMILPTLIMI